MQKSLKERSAFLQGPLFSQPISRVLFFKLSSILLYCCQYTLLRSSQGGASNPKLFLFFCFANTKDNLGVADSLIPLDYPYYVSV